ncbi:MAG: tRNA (adenosine(37)-N6)-threonylcarbamoyltransferase complex dimerization subunit type 1 TsaB [Bacteroidales bacterium]|nr:tRNA (adenosine(37)-N6)-threonylcarbamoyltransferase complex dimerization subunit type 1 TsaB [Bacteroidales bacterium]MBQ6957519.1 tRNA (adenosine(37)-N6)-threonylcarbamoyltransferase complex dimerization subunit type 1 TsaB [Bacteroidales bacterium]
MREKILMIETSTECCSVALADGTQILASRVNETPRQHAAQLVPYIQEVLKESGVSANALDAVAVSEGPGSYTGLRVGVSTAKGICFGAGVPLIGIDTLEILARQAEGRHDRIIAMLDARRMEVYAAPFDGACHKLGDTRAVILDNSSYWEELDAGTVLFIGTGVEKFQSICQHPNARFQPCFPLATAMIQPALAALQKKEFKDVAYFEPFYLKEFVAGISRKSVL